MARLSSAFEQSPLRHPLFLSVWFASICSGLGLQLQMVGASWAMTVMTQSPKMVTLVMFATNAPLLLFSVVFGAFSDLHDRRKVIGIAHAIMFFAAGMMAVLAFMDAMQPYYLLALTFIIGIGFALNLPAWQASVRQLVPAKELSAAVAVNSVGTNFARIAGPALGGAVIAVGGLKSAFGLNAFAYIPMLATLWFWARAPYKDERSDETLSQAIGAGFRFTFYSGVLTRIVMRSAFGSVVYIALTSLLPLVVAEQLKGSADSYGLLLSCMGGGALIAVMFGARITKTFTPEALLRMTHLGMAFAMLVIALSHSMILTAAMMLIFGAASAIMMLTFNVCMQLSAPGWIVGRSMAVFQMGAFGGLALGALLWGSVASTVGVITSLYAAAGFAVVIVLILGRIMPLAWPDPSGLEPARVSIDPPDFAPEHHHIPIDVRCDYQIAPQNEQRFLEIMEEWRSIRLSLGVRNWSLQRDPDDPEHWIESFSRPTAAELMRQYARRTAREEDIIRRLGELHSGDQPPVHTLKLRDGT